MDFIRLGLSKKYYGGVFPVFNIIISNFMMLMFIGRIKYLEYKNKIKNLISDKDITLINNSSVCDTFKKYLNDGYTKINIGGGRYNLEGFINIDFSNFKDVERQVVANILDLSFIPDGSITHIYSNQLIEHLNDYQINEQLGQYNRILKDDGLISIRTPNGLGVCYGYWFEPIKEKNHNDFLELGYPKDAMFCDLRDDWYHGDFFAFIHWLYADIGNIKNQHLTIFTPTLMREYLVSNDFEVLKMTEPESSQIIVMAKKCKEI